MHSPHTFDPHLVEEECGRNKKRRIDASLHGSKDAERETSNEGAANRSGYFVSGGSVSVLSPPLASVGAQPRSTRGDFRLNNSWYLIDPS